MTTILKSEKLIRMDHSLVFSVVKKFQILSRLQTPFGSNIKRILQVQIMDSLLIILTTVYQKSMESLVTSNLHYIQTFYQMLILSIIELLLVKDLLFDLNSQNYTSNMRIMKMKMKAMKKITIVTFRSTFSMDLMQIHQL
jgi:hypothetical protein